MRYATNDAEMGDNEENERLRGEVEEENSNNRGEPDDRYNTMDSDRMPNT